MPTPSSTIAAGTTIRGHISAEGDLELHGHVEGSIAAKGGVIVAAGALVKSDIEAMRVRVAGAVAGNVRGSELVVLEQGARVVGDICAPTIGIRPGALLRGRVDTGEAPRAASKEKSRDEVRPAPARATVAAARVVKPAPARAAVAQPEPELPKRPPAPVVPALQKRTKKAAKRRAK
jgi:cytoskeletal protein CcmA (bactofilin family)